MKDVLVRVAADDDACCSAVPVGRSPMGANAFRKRCTVSKLRFLGRKLDPSCSVMVIAI